MEFVSRLCGTQWSIIFGTLLFPMFWAISSRFRYFAKIFYFGILAALTSFTLTILFLPHPGSPNNLQIAKWLIKKCRTLFGIRWELRGGEKLRKQTGPCIIISNHQSSIDIIGIMEIVPERCTLVSKESLKYYGAFGIAALLSGFVFINRCGKEKAIEKLNKTLANLQERNLKLWIFPEGTRGREVSMLPFKKGPFHLAVQGQLPIIPIVFSRYSCFYSRHEKKFLSGGLVIIEVLDPIDTNGMTIDSVQDLSLKTRQRMMEVYERISPEAAAKFKIIGK